MDLVGPVVSRRVVNIVVRCMGGVHSYLWCAFVLTLLDVECVLAKLRWLRLCVYSEYSMYAQYKTSTRRIRDYSFTIEQR